MATTTMCKLSEPLTEKVLSYLECPRKAPTLRYLNRLIHAYIRRVPFESISRICQTPRHAPNEALSHVQAVNP
jgi:arylamine N-acetyltransferase